MISVLRRFSMVLPLTILCCVCLCFTAKAQSSNTRTLFAKSVTTTSIEYQLTLVEPEMIIEKAVACFLSKAEIKSCVANGNVLTIVTESQIPHKTIIELARANGFIKTYNAYIVEKDPRRAVDFKPTVE